jgi:hypothetical protein
MVSRALARFPGNFDLHQAWSELMQECEGLDHMNRINEDGSSTEERYYLPRHAVCNSSNFTSQRRVVLDVSFCSSNGTCLNDMLLVGPTMQQYLYFIILPFRT